MGDRHTHFLLTPSTEWMSTRSSRGDFLKKNVWFRTDPGAGQSSN
jgi:hypothetical protein